MPLTKNRLLTQKFLDKYLLSAKKYVIINIMQCIRIVNIYMPKWRNGRRTGLKIPRGQPHKGSTPFFGTIEHLLCSFFYLLGF